MSGDYSVWHIVRNILLLKRVNFRQRVVVALLWIAWSAVLNSLRAISSKMPSEDRDHKNQQSITSLAEILEQ